MKRILLTLIILGGVSGAMAQEKPCTLQECLEIGLENNYSVRIVRNNERISDNNATRANAGALPTVGMTAGYSGRFDDTRTTVREGESYSTHGVYNQSANVGLNASWDLFDGFRIQSNYEKLQELKSLGAIQTRIKMEDFVTRMTSE